MTSSYDLVDEPWVPVLEHGSPTLLSLRHTFERAPQLDGLAGAPNTVNVAVLRQVLLAVLLDALGAPRSRSEWAGRFQAGTFDVDALDAYLDRHRDRFDLFSDSRPFAQVAGLRTAKDEVKTTAVIIAGVAAGNNAPLFSVHTDDRPVVLSPAEAVLWLLHAHCWDTAAIKSGAVGDPKMKAGKTTGNPTGPLGFFGVVVPTGPTLFETLMLNLPVIPDGLRPDDRPSWRRANLGAAWEERSAVGPVELLTWQSRRIRLVPVGGWVQAVVLAGGDRLTGTPDFEPHTAWRLDAKAGGLRPLRYRFGRSAWQGLPGLLAVSGETGGGDRETTLLLAQIRGLLAAEHLPADFRLGVETTGVRYGNQSAVIEDISGDAIPLPLAALLANEDVGEFVERLAGDTDGLVKALDVLERQVREAGGGDPIPWDAGQRSSAALVPLLDPVARRLLAGLQAQPYRLGEAGVTWRAVARRHAMRIADEVLLHAAPRATVAGQSGGGRGKSAASMERSFRRAVTTILGAAPVPEAVA